VIRPSALGCSARTIAAELAFAAGVMDNAGFSSRARPRSGLLESLPDAVRAQAAKLATAPADASLAAARDTFEHWPFDREWVRPAIAPTIPLHCSDAFMTGCATLAHEFAIGFQTHLAETKTQALLALQRYGESMVEHLVRLGLTGSNFSAAHGIWIDEHDIARFADAGASVVHNPMSNLRIGSGVAPARAMLDAGLNLAIGTDATNTSDGQNMFEALRLAAYLSRIADPDPARWLSGGCVPSGNRRQCGRARLSPSGSPRSRFRRGHRLPRPSAHQLRAAARAAPATRVRRELHASASADCARAGARGLLRSAREPGASLR